MSTQAPVRPEEPTTHSPPPPQPGPGAGTMMLGLVLIAAGGLWLLAALGIDIPVAMVAPVVHARRWSSARSAVRTTAPSVFFLGVWLAIGAIVTAVVDVPLTGAVGDQLHVPTTATQLDDGYRMFAGTQTLDLREIELVDGTTEVALSTVLGEVEVVVPAGMAVRVDAAAAGGAIDLYGTTIDGLGLDDQAATDDWDEAARRVELQLRVGLGEITVRTG